MRQLVSPELFGDRHVLIDLNRGNDVALPDALAAISAEAEQAVRAGKVLICLSDRYLRDDAYPVHALLATGAVHHHLVRQGLRCSCNLLVETGVARDSHHFACLIGYGATAVYPYLAYQSLHRMVQSGNVDSRLESVRQLGRSYRRGIRKGLYKIMSKMGISTITSYRGAQLFEIVGLADEVVDTCFTGTVSRIGGTSFADLRDDQLALTRFACDRTEPISRGGLLRYVHDTEYHCYNPDVIATLQAAVQLGDYEHYKAYARLVNERAPATLRDLLVARPDRQAGAARRGGTGRGHRAPFRQRRHVAGGAVARGPRGTGDCDEPARCPLEFG